MRRLLVTSALFACLFSGCGGEDEGGQTVATSEALVQVVADEYSFDPGTIIYEGGGGGASFTIALDNRGSLAHNLKVFDGDREVGGTPTFPGGQEKSGEVQLEPGEYRMVCTVGDHEELGMHGTLQVR